MGSLCTVSHHLSDFIRVRFGKVRAGVLHSRSCIHLSSSCNAGKCTQIYCCITSKVKHSSATKRRIRGSRAQLREEWLNSFSYPVPPLIQQLSYKDEVDSCCNVDMKWVLGIDPDLSGALAVLKYDGSKCDAEVFDSPSLHVYVGKNRRRRLDAKSIVHLVKGFNAPIGTYAYIEQSRPLPFDGKEAWWCSGFGYGLWVGILVACGFSVVPVVSTTWKNQFGLPGGKSGKDGSRRTASSLFPSLHSFLQRKKDHGRAEAILIAAYGRGLKADPNSGFLASLIDDNPVPI